MIVCTKICHLLGNYFLSNLLFGLENVAKMILFCTNLYSAKNNKDKDIGYTFIYYNDNLASGTLCALGL